MANSQDGSTGETAQTTPMGDAVRICLITEISEGMLHRHSAGELDIVLCRVGTTVHAVKNECTHQQVFLHRGWLGEGPNGQCAIVCPAHGAKFDPVTGAALVGPAVRPLPTYQVELRGDEVWVRSSPIQPPSGGSTDQGVR